MVLGTIASTRALVRSVLKLTDSDPFGLDSVTDCHRTVIFQRVVRIGATAGSFGVRSSCLTRWTSS